MRAGSLAIVLAGLMIVSPAAAETFSKVRSTSSVKVVDGRVVGTVKTNTRVFYSAPDVPTGKSVTRSVFNHPSGARTVVTTRTVNGITTRDVVTMK